METGAAYLGKEGRKTGRSVVTSAFADMSLSCLQHLEARVSNQLRVVNRCSDLDWFHGGMIQSASTRWSWGLGVLDGGPGGPVVLNCVNYGRYQGATAVRLIFPVRIELVPHPAPPCREEKSVEGLQP